MAGNAVKLEAPTFSEVLPRLDALNSHARTRQGGGSLARVIYHYKREALHLATLQQIATHRVIAVRAKCSHCGGSGRYTDWSGYAWPHCRRCSSTGSVTLRFIESTLAGLRWHTPERDAGRFISGAWQMPAENADDWTVHQPGRELDVEQLADHLLAVEAFFVMRPPQPYWTNDGYGPWDPHGTYQIYAGESDPSRCVICGSAIALPEGSYPHRLGLSTGRVAWTAIVCDACGGHGRHPFDAASRRFPEYLWTPALRRWAEAHPKESNRG